ncbi:hypothetical protein [Planktothrix sp.]|uniref:hypothetical protein n=1 Tax=Planktothrix sp. TaxID=3088171 RepID=UPI0038D4699E
MTTTTKTKKNVRPESLANLDPMAALKEPEKRRTVHASARLTQSTKEKLSTMLDEMDLSLADLLEKIASKEIVIVEKN